jgi:hypothetical protein
MEISPGKKGRAAADRVDLGVSTGEVVVAVGVEGDEG